jgi:hypothetical protein
MKSDELLQHFTKFCQANPHLSFWHALLGWIKTRHDSSFSAILVLKTTAQGNQVFDTFNWTGEDSPLVLFKDEIK